MGVDLMEGSNDGSSEYRKSGGFSLAISGHPDLTSRDLCIATDNARLSGSPAIRGSRARLSPPFADQTDGKQARSLTRRVAHALSRIGEDASGG